MKMPSARVLARVAAFAAAAVIGIAVPTIGASVSFADEGGTTQPPPPPPPTTDSHGWIG